jgi:hypothetical protein
METETWLPRSQRYIKVEIRSTPNEEDLETLKKQLEKLLKDNNLIDWYTVS